MLFACGAFGQHEEAWMKTIFTCTIALLLFGCGYDPGGKIDTYIEKARQARKEGRLVQITGDCFSACIIRLSSGNVCVASYVSFGVHEVRSTPPGWEYQHSPRSEQGTEKLKRNVPECARKLFDAQRAFDAGDPTEFQAEEVVAACPGIITLCDSPYVVFQGLLPNAE